MTKYQKLKRKYKAIWFMKLKDFFKRECKNIYQKDALKGLVIEDSFKHYIPKSVNQDGKKVSDDICKNCGGIEIGEGY